MHDQQLSHAMKKAIDQRLSGLEGDPWLARRIINAEKGEPPRMKKKLTVSLVFILIFTLLTLGAAAALVHSRIADHLYGNEASVPEEVLSQIQAPQQTAATPLGSITLDELYYDGNALHTIISIANPTGETLLYTLDGFLINGQGASGSNLFSEGPGSYGWLLGGAVKDKALPITGSYYEKWQQVAAIDENGKFLGWDNIPGGKISLKILMDVWRPLNAPQLVNYKDFEGYDVNIPINCLVTDERGECNLELFRPENARRNYTLGQSGGVAYESVFEELGWAERLDTIEMTLEVDLDQMMISRAVSEQKEYLLNGHRIAFDSFELTHAGGSLEGRIYGDRNSVYSFLEKGLVLVDLKGDRELSHGCIWSNEINPDGSIPFTILLSPIAANLPETVYLAQPVAYNDQYVEGYPHFDPAVKKPENIIGTWELNLNQMLEINLHMEK